MSEQTLNLIERIRQRLQIVMRRVTMAEVLFGLALTLGITGALLLLGTGLEAGFWMGRTARWVFTALFVLAGLGLGLRYLILPLLRMKGWLPGLSEESIAQRIGQRFPEVSDRLTNLLQLAGGQSSRAPQPMLDRAISELGRQIEDVPFEGIEDFNGARKAGRAAAVPLVGLMMFLLVAPGMFTDAAGRLFSPGTEFRAPAPFSLNIMPGSTELVKGESLNITITAIGSSLPRTLFLNLGNVDEDRTEVIRLTADSTGTFRHRLVNVRQSKRYQVTAGPVVSEWYTAEIVERPLVRNLQVNLDFPAYSKIPPRRLPPNVGDVAALAGTTVSLDLTVGGSDLASAQLEFDQGETVELTPNGNQVSGQFALQKSGTYQIVLTSPAGVQNADPITYTLNVQNDAVPSIVLLAPRPSEDLSDNLETDLRARIIDDFGFSDLKLFYRLSESRYGETMSEFEPIQLAVPNPSLLDQEVDYHWFLIESTGLDLVPDDVIEYYLEVRDNDTVAGFKAGRTPIHVLRLPSLAEQYEELETQQEGTQDELESLLQESQELRETFEELRDEMRRKPEADWEDKRQLERIQEQQQALEERIESLSERIEDMTETMADNNLVDEETLKKYQDLQQVMEEINSPELMEALRKLQEAMQNLDLSQMQQSIGDFEFNEEQYQKRLERALELFKRLLVEQKLDEAARRAEELTSEQERMAEETRKLMEEGEEGRDPQEQNEANEDPSDENTGEDENTGDQQESGDRQEGENGENDQSQQDEQNNEQQASDTPQQDGQQPKSAEELASEQQRSKEEMEALEALIEQIQEQMDEMQNVPSDQMEQMQNQLQQQDLPQQMQQNSEQLQQNQLNQAQQGQQQMSRQLQQFQQQLSQMQQQMSAQQMQVNLAALRRVLDDVLSLSKSQESLRDQAETLSPDHPSMRRYSQQQVELSDGLRVVSDTLQRLSKDIPQMSRTIQQRSGEALRDMEQAVMEMSERKMNQATGHQKSSMTNLNELALLLSDLMDQMQNQQNGQGGGMSMQQMLQQLQQMAGQQQQLNQQLQNMLNDIQGNRLSQDQQQRLQQMAAQQEAIRRQLQDLMQQQGNEALNQLLGDLDRVGQQMEESIQEFMNQNVDRRTIQRQHEILTRLLDAQRSIRERGREKKREGRSGEDVTRTSPTALPPSERAEKLRRDLLRALESGYAPDYEELIKRYFDVLQERMQEAPSQN